MPACKEYSWLCAWGSCLVDVSGVRIEVLVLRHAEAHAVVGRGLRHAMERLVSSARKRCASHGGCCAHPHACCSQAQQGSIQRGSSRATSAARCPFIVVTDQMDRGLGVQLTRPLRRSSHQSLMRCRGPGRCCPPPSCSSTTDTPVNDGHDVNHVWSCHAATLDYEPLSVGISTGTSSSIVPAGGCCLKASASHACAR